MNAQGFLSSLRHQQSVLRFIGRSQASIPTYRTMSASPLPKPANDAHGQYRMEATFLDTTLHTPSYNRKSIKTRLYQPKLPKLPVQPASETLTKPAPPAQPLASNSEDKTTLFHFVRNFCDQICQLGASERWWEHNHISDHQAKTTSRNSSIKFLCEQICQVGSSEKYWEQPQTYTNQNTSIKFLCEQICQVGSSEKYWEQPQTYTNQNTSIKFLCEQICQVGSSEKYWEQPQTSSPSKTTTFIRDQLCQLGPSERWWS